MHKQSKQLLLNAVVTATVSIAAPVNLTVAQESGIHYMTIGRWINTGGGGGSTADYSDANADTTLSIGNSAVQADNDGSGYDFACSHTLSRSASVFWVSGSGSDGDISSSPEFFYVNSAAVFLKVVPSISWCGAAGTFAGCTVIGAKNSMLATASTLRSTNGGYVAVHEYGHAIGLNHSSNTSNFMVAPGNSSFNRLTSTQCNIYRSVANNPNGPGGTSGSMMPTEVEDVDYSSISIEELARRPIVDRMPIEVEDFYGDDDRAKLRSLLTDSEEAEHHQTIAGLLGLLSNGEDEDATALMAFVDAHRDEVVARAAVIALGYVGARGNARALSYLRKGAKDTTSPLINSAVLALGLSGAPGVASELEGVRRQSRAAPGGRPQVNAANGRDRIDSPTVVLETSTLDESIRVAGIVNQKGLRGYYKDAK